MLSLKGQLRIVEEARKTLEFFLNGHLISEAFPLFDEFLPSNMELAHQYRDCKCYTIFPLIRPCSIDVDT